jgi:hypothetical protein
MPARELRHGQRRQLRRIDERLVDDLRRPWGSGAAPARMQKPRSRPDAIKQLQSAIGAWGVRPLPRSDRNNLAAKVFGGQRPANRGPEPRLRRPAAILPSPTRSRAVSSFGRRLPPECGERDGPTRSW